MNRLLKIARTATPGTGVQLRKDKYGGGDLRSFLRDVLALANAPVDGPRYIIVGADFDSRGQKRLHSIDAEDFSGKPSYQSLANEYIEPPLRIRYKPVNIDGKRIGIFEIGDSQGDEPIIDASLSIIMPNHNAFYVAETLPKVPRNDGFAARTPDEIAAYPSVTLKDDSVQVTSKIGDIPVGEPIDVFVSPLRLCVGKDLSGKRFGIRYALHGQNLRSPAKGKLRLLFK